MQKPEELVDKIRREENDLSANLNRLEHFMMTKDFIKISPEQKTLLEQQHKVMTEYKLILIKRAHRINWEAGRDKAAAEIKEALEQEGKERISDEVCRECKYYNAKEDICTNRGNKDGKCWETKEQEYPLCPFRDGNIIPKCINLRGDKCSSPDTICYKSARKPKKEEEDGTQSN